MQQIKIKHLTQFDHGYSVQLKNLIRALAITLELLSLSGSLNLWIWRLSL